MDDIQQDITWDEFLYTCEVVDTETLWSICADYDEWEYFEVARGPGGVPFQGAPVPRYEVTPLSTVHKSRICEWSEGAGLFKLSTGEKGQAIEGVKRGVCKGFSRASRLRLIRTLARVRRDADMPLFVTLTFPENYPTVEKSKELLKYFRERLKYNFPSIGYVWKLEPQKRGAPHFHCLMWGISFEDAASYIPNAWHELAGQGDKNHLLFHLGLLHHSQPCVQQIRSYAGIMFYASKYLGKVVEGLEGWEKVGRYWAVVNKNNIPFGEDMIMYIEEDDFKTFRKYQQKYSGLRFRSGQISSTILCDADQWVRKILQAKEDKKYRDTLAEK